MNFVEVFASSREDAKKEVFDVLNKKAMDVLSNMQEDGVQVDEEMQLDEGGVNGQYHEDNPKIDLHNKHNGMYIASTKWSKTVKHAVDTYEKKYPEMKGSVRGYLSEDINVSEGNDATFVGEEFVVVEEGLRRVDKFEDGRHKATIHKDSDLGEYKVMFHTDGKHLPEADYFTDDLDDARGTAKTHLKGLGKNFPPNKQAGGQVSEDVDSKYENGIHSAVIHHDETTDKYVVEFFIGEVRMDADYVTDNKGDAESFAKRQVDQMYKYIKGDVTLSEEFVDAVSDMLFGTGIDESTISTIANSLMVEGIVSLPLAHTVKDFIGTVLTLKHKAAKKSGHVIKHGENSYSVKLYDDGKRTQKSKFTDFSSAKKHLEDTLYGDKQKSIDESFDKDITTDEHVGKLMTMTHKTKDKSGHIFKLGKSKYQVQLDNNTKKTEFTDFIEAQQHLKDTLTNGTK